MDYNSRLDGSRTSFKKLVGKEPKTGLEAAELYAEMGLAVIPCNGKKPTLKGWPDQRLRTEDLARHFGGGKNVGLLLGEPSGGLACVDLDVPEARAIKDCFLPKTLTGGREGAPDSHLYYSAPGAKTRKWQGPDSKVLLELRSDGCFMLVEPSVHPSGECYVWDREGVLEPLRFSSEELARRCSELATATVLARRLPEKGRHDFALALAGYLLPRADEETVLEIVLAAWRAAGVEDSEVERELEGVVRDTARKLADGEPVLGGPRLAETDAALLGLLDRWWGKKGRGRGSDDGARGEKGDTPTHDVLRDRWLAAHEEPPAYGQGEWRRYGAGIWVPVHQQVVDGEVDRVLEEAKPEGIRPTAGARSSVERLARAKAFVQDERWDANEDVLVCANGALEVSRGILRDHRPDDYALGAVPYAFDPTASAPAWRRFIASTVPEAEGFLQEFAGYSLTGDTSHEMAVWLHGPPGSGKSTLIEGLRAALGPRGGLLGLAEIQRSRFALADLPGKTLVVAFEQPSEYLSSTDLLNNIISGEAVKVEEKFKPAYTVVPRAKVLWAMNELPRVKDANSGLFRRVNVVRFSELREERDPKIKEAVRGEGAGILVWALEGLWRLRERGHFDIPNSVRAATDDFRRTNDVPAMFVAEACLTSDLKGCEEQAQKLYGAYRRWCQINGHKPLSSTSVSAEWRRLGFDKKIVHGRSFYRGIQVHRGWLAAHEDQPYG